MLLMAGLGKGVAAEQPGRSYLFAFPSFRALEKMIGYYRADFHSCCWGGARRKLTAIFGNVLMSILQAECHHVHDLKEWAPAFVDSKWYYTLG